MFLPTYGNSGSPGKAGSVSSHFWALIWRSWVMITCSSSVTWGVELEGGDADDLPAALGGVSRIEREHDGEGSTDPSDAVSETGFAHQCGPEQLVRPEVPALLREITFDHKPCPCLW
jgi:hypothetical protein